MLLWFAGCSLAAAWIVFQSPALDHRLVVVGSLVPLLEAVLGGPRALHSVSGPVLVLVVVMLATRGRRLLRRRLLGIPIGLFLHLVLDGAWTDTRAFWWPFAGRSFVAGPLPELHRGALGLAMEVVGAGALWWCWSRFGLADADRRRRFLHEGRVDRHP